MRATNRAALTGLVAWRLSLDTVFADAEKDLAQAEHIGARGHIQAHGRDRDDFVGQQSVDITIGLGSGWVAIVAVTQLAFMVQRQALGPGGPIDAPPRKAGQAPFGFFARVRGHINLQHIDIVRQQGMLHQPGAELQREIRRHAEIDSVGVAEVQVGGRLLADGDCGDSQAGCFQRRADRAGYSHAVAGVLAIIDAGDQERRFFLGQLQNGVLHRLRRCAVDRVGAAIAAINGHFVGEYAPFAIMRQTATHAGLLFARRRYQQAADVAKCRHQCPQAGRFDAVIVGEQYNGFLRLGHETFSANKPYSYSLLHEPKLKGLKAQLPSIALSLSLVEAEHYHSRSAAAIRSAALTQNIKAIARSSTAVC